MLNPIEKAATFYWPGGDRPNMDGCPNDIQGAFEWTASRIKFFENQMKGDFDNYFNCLWYYRYFWI